MPASAAACVVVVDPGHLSVLFSSLLHRVVAAVSSRAHTFPPSHLHAPPRLADSSRCLGGMAHYQRIGTLSLADFSFVLGIFASVQMSTFVPGIFASVQMRAFVHVGATTRYKCHLTGAHRGLLLPIRYQVKRRLSTNIIPSIPRGLRNFFAGASPSVRVALSFNSPSLVSLYSLSLSHIIFLSFSSFFLPHFSSLLYCSLLCHAGHRPARASGVALVGGRADGRGAVEARGWRDGARGWPGLVSKRVRCEFLWSGESYCVLLCESYCIVVWILLCWD
jgi:hypothetical protein